MSRITGEIATGAQRTWVSGFVAGQRNEPARNPHMARSAKVTPGLAGKGTQFRSAVRQAGRAGRCTGGGEAARSSGR